MRHMTSENEFVLIFAYFSNKVVNRRTLMPRHEKDFINTTFALFPNYGTLMLKKCCFIIHYMIIHNVIHV